VDLDVRPVFNTFMAMTCTYSVELPGIEPACLPGNLPSERQFRSGSFHFSPAGYVRLCFRVLTPSRAVDSVRSLIYRYSAASTTARHPRA
jgi:hypothetical protein